MTLIMISSEISKSSGKYSVCSPARDIIKAVETKDKVVLPVIDEIPEITCKALTSITNILNASRTVSISLDCKWYDHRFNDKALSSSSDQ